MPRRRWRPPYVSEDLPLDLIDAATSSRDRALIGVMGLLGLRAGCEAVMLDIEDIDLVRRVLHIRRGKGGKEAWLPFEEPLTSLLREHVVSLSRQSGPMFCSDQPGHRGRRLTRKGVWHIVKVLAAHAGLDPRTVWPHACRTAFVTHVALRVGVAQAKELARHQSLATTTVYVEVSPEHLRSAVTGLWGRRGRRE